MATTMGDLGLTVAKASSFILRVPCEPTPGAAEIPAEGEARVVVMEKPAAVRPVATPMAAQQPAAAPDKVDEENQVFAQALSDAFSSALTKLDCLETYFAAGRGPVDLTEMFVQELQEDGDLRPLLDLADNKVEAMRAFVRTAVGKRFGEWKKIGGNAVKEKKEKEVPVPLPWTSIDAYPEWVMDKIQIYSRAEPAEQEAARQHLEDTLLGKKARVLAASIKYDGTCFGKMDNGELVGRKFVLGKHCEEYQRTSTEPASRCDVAALSRSVAEICGAEVNQLCLWGELMCNPNFYGYKERGVANKWICFGVVAAFAASETNTPDDANAISQRLAERGLAHRLNFKRSGSQVYLMLCPALRQLLVDVAKCEHVAEAPFEDGLSHAEVVSRAAASLRSGQNEGLVLVFEGARGQASLRKWKNSAEGVSARQKEAELLKKWHGLCARHADEGRLDPRIADMVEAMRSVAEAETKPLKGRRGNNPNKGA